MNSQLEKAIKLAKKTGDKLIVIDENDNTSLAIMSLSEYEDLVDGKDENDSENVDIKSLTEEELLDKINRDIVMWQENNKDKELEDDFLSSEAEEEEEKEAEEENLYYYEEADKTEPEMPVKEAAVKEESKNNWQISSEIKDRAEKID